MNSDRIRSAMICLMCGVTIVGAVGCSGSADPERVSVRGHVTLDGIPLGLGLVRLIPIDPQGGPGAMTTIVGGDFEFTVENGPVVGQHRVEIEATDFQAFDIDDEAAFAREMAATGKSPLAENPVPERYNTASQLTARIEAVDNPPLKFDLQTDDSARTLSIHDR